MSLTPKFSKADIRESFKKFRLQLPKGYDVEEGRRALIHFRKFYAHFENWILYSPIQKEISTEPLFEDLKTANKQIYFPKIDGENLNFYRVKDLSELAVGKLSKEPSSTNKLAPNSSTAIVIPGVAFSREGDRIGFGRGFYDRSLSEHANFFRIGFAYDWQIVSTAWATDTFDEKLSKIISPSAVWA